MKRNRVYKAQDTDGRRTLHVVAPNMKAANALAEEAFHGGRFTLHAETEADGKARLSDETEGVTEIMPPVETPLDGLADTVEAYIRRHRVERQSTQLTSQHAVTLTIIQNEWARRSGGTALGIAEAPEQVIRAIETTPRGHELFDRQRDKADGTVAYALRKPTESRR